MHRIIALCSLALGVSSLAVAGAVSVVPEPGSFFLVAGGLAAGVLLLRKKRKS